MPTYLNQILFSLGVIVILLEAVFVNADSKICQTSNGKFPKAGTFCKGFYECKNWVPVEKSCPKGNNFIPNRGHCNWHLLFECPETVPKHEQFKCPHSWGEYPNIHWCSMYWWCLGGESLIEKCAPFQLFDKIEMKCVAEIDAVCADETDIVEQGYKCPWIVGSYSFQKDCSKYYDCLVNVPSPRTCPRDRLFDENENKCLPKELVPCGSRFNPYDLSTTEKVIFTEIPTLSTPSDDQNKKNTTLEAYPPSTSTNKPSTSTYSTLDPDSEKTNSKDLETSTSVFIESTSTETQQMFLFTSNSTPSSVLTSSKIPSTTHLYLERNNSDDLIPSTTVKTDSTSVKIQSTPQIVNPFRRFIENTVQKFLALVEYIV